MSCQIRKMKMMAAAGCQERSTNPESVKQFNDQLAKIQAERARQDAMWNEAVPKSECGVNKLNCTQNTITGYNTKNFLISNQGPW